MGNLLRRLWSSITAFLAALFGRPKDQASVVAQQIRKIEQDVHAAKTAAAKAAADVKRLEDTRADKLRQADECAQRASQELQNGREDSARDAIQRELQLRKAAEDLVPTHAALDARCREMQREVQALQVKLDEAKVRLRQLSVHQGTLELQQHVAGVQEELGDDLDASTVGRLTQELDEWEAELGARETTETDPTRAQVRQVDAFTSDVDERLAALRSEMDSQQQQTQASEEN